MAVAANKLLIVEVIDAKNLLPKDGHGASSPYVVVDYYGQRKRTRTVVRDLNPSWNEMLKFNVGGPSDVFGDTLEIEVYHDKSYGPTRRHNFLGKVHLQASQYFGVRKGEEALMYFPLEKKHLLSWISGDIGLKIYQLDEDLPPPAPPSPPRSTVPPPSPKPDQEVKTETQPESAEPPPEHNNEADQDPLAMPGTVTEEAKPESPEPTEPPCDTAPSPIQSTPPTPSRRVPHSPLHRRTPQTPTRQGSEPLPPASPRPPPTPRSQSVIPNIPPQPEIKASFTSASIPEIRIATNNNGGNGWRPPTPIPPAITRNFSTTSLESAASSMERSTFDLVDKMHYLFIRIVKARSLPTHGNPVVKIVVTGDGTRVVSNPARKTAFFEWDQTFAFGRNSAADTASESSILEISVWDPLDSSTDSGHDFLGGICFDVSEIPLRDPPDSPLAPQWYRLEGGGAHTGDLMLATWLGTQADDSFPDAWKTDVTGNLNSKAKVYLSPKLWYLRATVMEAQDVMLQPPPSPTSRESSSSSLFQIKAQVGFQVARTKPSVSRNGGSPPFNEDLLFVVSEPFTDELIFTLESRHQKGPIPVGVTRIPLSSIERRVDDRKVAARWVTLEDPRLVVTDDAAKRVYRGRVQLRLCFDGGYHVMDEPAHVCSDYRPTAKQLWKPSIGTVELGIIGCKNLVPVKSVNCKGTTDAYAVAKYGTKWVRTRTVSDCLDPKWNEQYTFRVYDPCTVLTVGIFDSSDSSSSEESGKENGSNGRQDFRIGKVRVRISTLQRGRVYRNRYPLMLLTSIGLKKMGEIELAMRFVRNTPTLDVLQVYTQPLLPIMHHLKPLGLGQQDMLRNAAAKILSEHLSRSEPPLRRETVLYMLDADSHSFSMRKVRANWLRIVNVIAGVIDFVRWLDDTRMWKKPTGTILVHALLVLLVWFPDLIIPTLATYVFSIGAWNYRFRSRDPLPHFDTKLSLAENVDRDELDEEFDVVPSMRPPELVRARYDKLRMFGSRVQTVLGDVATQGERVQSLVTWRDPRVTGIFVGLCLLVAMVWYLVPPKMMAMAGGFYYLRHPMFRDRAPSPVFNFFRRLPSLADRML